MVCLTRGLNPHASPFHAIFEWLIIYEINHCGR